MEEMVKVLRRMGIRDERVLAAMAAVDRKDFVPDDYRHLAYADTAIPISAGQTISQPYTVARMLEILTYDIRDTIYDKRVLEIGTGSGWQTAILSRLFWKVYSIEIIPKLAHEAKLRIENGGLRNIKLKIGDGKEGWPEYLPYDGIICGADAREIPKEWEEQLKDGGRIVCPIRGEMIRITKIANSNFQTEKSGRYIFVPLV